MTELGGPQGVKSPIAEGPQLRRSSSRGLPAGLLDWQQHEESFLSGMGELVSVEVVRFPGPKPFRALWIKTSSLN